jgi:hypothetical protein
MRMRWMRGLVAFLLLTSPAWAALVPSDHEHFQYSGRIDFTDRKAPKISWPATSIRTRFTGTSLKIILADQKGKNRFGVYLDGSEKPHVIPCQKGRSIYDVANDLDQKTHRLLIVKRTEGGHGETVFCGLEIDTGAILKAPDPRPTLRIEVFGDSISCGLGNEAAGKKQEHDPACQNAYMAYGAIAARGLNAEYRCTSKSGIGLIKSWFPLTMPSYYNRASAIDGAAAIWDFTKWQADIVVINLFQNDSWTIKKHPVEQERVLAYLRFIFTLRKHYPKAHLICTLGSMSASRTSWAGYVKAAVEKARAAGDRKVHAYIFKTQTGDMHPRVNHHQTMAGELSTFIRATCGLK